MSDFWTKIFLISDFRGTQLRPSIFSWARSFSVYHYRSDQTTWRISRTLAGKTTRVWSVLLIFIYLEYVRVAHQTSLSGFIYIRILFLTGGSLARKYGTGLWNAYNLVSTADARPWFLKHFVKFYKLSNRYWMMDIDKQLYDIPEDFVTHHHLMHFSYKLCILAGLS